MKKILLFGLLGAAAFMLIKKKGSAAASIPRSDLILRFLIFTGKGDTMFNRTKYTEFFKGLTNDQIVAYAVQEGAGENEMLNGYS